MPRKNSQWDEIRCEGNPTRSIAVNSLIKRVSTHEVRRQGVHSLARRPIEFGEFLNVLEIIRLSLTTSESIRYCMGSALILQWQLIGRVDDMMKLKFENFSFNPSHPYTLICQMRWSKNIREERDSPSQILLGSMDERLCVLLNLAVYLEMQRDTVDSPFIFGNGAHGDRMIRAQLNNALENAQFKKMIAGNLGTHSIRKGAATYCSRNSLSIDHIESRGRWRNSKKQVNTYIDISRPIPDAIVAYCLCGPNGAIKYDISPGHEWLTDIFLSTKIATNISKMLTPDIGAVLGRALLYAATQRVATTNAQFELIPRELKLRIEDAVNTAAGTSDIDQLPELIKRVSIYISGTGGELLITPMTNNINSVESNGSISDELFKLNARVGALQRRMEENHTAQQQLIAELSRNSFQQFNRLTSITRRIADQPISRTTFSHLNNTEEFIGVCLSKRPGDLFALWQEYEHGRGGMKPARHFPTKERGRCKWMYSFRLNFWGLVDKLISRGHSSDTAIDAIYSVYGRSLSTTAILRAIRNDKGRGGHPNL